MAVVKICDMFTVDFQARPEVNFTNDEGKAVSIPASEARLGRIILGELPDMQKVNLEIPKTFTGSIKIGDTLDINCPALVHIEQAMRIKNVNRIFPAKS